LFDLLPLDIKCNIFQYLLEDFIDTEAWPTFEDLPNMMSARCIKEIQTLKRNILEGIPEVDNEFGFAIRSLIRKKLHEQRSSSVATKRAVLSYELKLLSTIQY